LCKVKVLRFSIGFGKELWKREYGKDRTEWVIAAVPLGGFVRIADERDGSATAEDRDRAFNTQTIPKRMFMIVAGPVANFVLAALLYWVVFVIGQPAAVPFVATPTPGSVAATAGFVDYDKITAVDGQSVQTWGDARLRLLDAATTRRTVSIEVQTRGGNQAIRTLPLASVTKADLDKDFLTPLGLIAYRPKLDAIAGEVRAGEAAAAAGLKIGDKILTVDGAPIAQWDDFTRIVRASPGKALKLTVVNVDDPKAEVFDAVITPTAVTQGSSTVGRVGMGARVDAAAQAAQEALFVNVRHNPIAAAGEAVVKVWDMSVFSLKMLGRMITGDVSWKNLSGPITIADYAGQSAKLGAVYYITFLALISVSIGVLNLLPIPVLDGGQLLYHIAELIKGSPISEKSLEIGQRLGVALLLGLTALAFFNDIQRLVSG
jgi:regulator of sigma E protease